MSQPWEMPPDTQLPDDICGYWSFPSVTQPGKEELMQILPNGRMVQLFYFKPEDTVARAGINNWLVPQGGDDYCIFLRLEKPGKPLQFRVWADTLLIDSPEHQWIATRVDPGQLPPWFLPTVAHYHTRMDQLEARARSAAQASVFTLASVFTECCGIGVPRLNADADEPSPQLPPPPAH